MKFITKLLLCLTISHACGALTGLAQQKRYCPAPPPSPFKHNAQIVTRLDRSADRMRTTLQHPRIIGRAGEGLYLSATFLYQDPKRPARPTLDLLFVSSSREFRYRQVHNLVILSDGKRAASIGEVRYQSRTDGQGMALEATGVTISYEELLNITRARKVVARIGASEFELSNNHLESLRELASLMAPPPSRWRAED
jgi:hypothetical protein